MPKKQLSNMTAQEFVEATAALGLKFKHIAKALGKHQATVSGYSTGRKAVPVEVVERIHELIREERDKIKARDGKLVDLSAGLGSLIVYQNEQRMAGNPEPHRTTGRFMRKQLQPDARVYPAYRMTHERYKLYVSALASWGARVRELAIEHTDEARQRDYQLELADLKAMAGCMPRNAPYDILIQHNEWDVVSRALRHYGTKSPELYRATTALRCHWLNHRGSGFPKHRHTAE